MGEKLEKPLLYKVLFSTGNGESKRIFHRGANQIV